MTDENDPHPIPTPEQIAQRRAQAIAAAAKTWATGMAATAYMTPREQAEAAWTPTSPYTVDALEDLIRADRGLDPLDRDGDGGS